MASNEVSRPIHVRFNGDNFSQWSQAISSYLKGRKLWRYVSGVRTIPVKEEKESDAAYDLRLEEAFEIAANRLRPLREIISIKKNMYRTRNLITGHI